jgi:hypothetical protein
MPLFVKPAEPLVCIALKRKNKNPHTSRVSDRHQRRNQKVGQQSTENGDQFLFEKILEIHGKISANISIGKNI